jgi:hypothetical protein
MQLGSPPEVIDITVRARRQEIRPAAQKWVSEAFGRGMDREGV